MSWKVIDDFLDMLNQYIQKHNLEAEQILNMKETDWGKNTTNSPEISTQEWVKKYIYAEGFFSRPHYHCAEWHRNRGPPSRHDHFQRFPTILEFCRPDKRVLCVLDKASCHLSVKAINICIKHNIDLLAVPPNCTNFLQSFDQIGLV